MTGELRTGGWYRYSHNPQYVGYVVAAVGIVLLANATLTAVLCVAYVGWWLTLPVTEESWLCEQYGDDDERYAEAVPRFVRLRTVRTLTGKRESAPTEDD